MTRTFSGERGNSPSCIWRKNKFAARGNISGLFQLFKNSSSQFHYLKSPFNEIHLFKNPITANDDDDDDDNNNNNNAVNEFQMHVTEQSPRFHWKIILNQQT